MAVLRVVRGPDLGQEFELHPEVSVLGRKPSCSIVLSHQAVSRSHARIERVESGYVIEDLDSHNGTLVNGEKCARKELSDNDRIKICGYELLFTEQPSINCKDDDTVS